MKSRNLLIIFLISLAAFLAYNYYKQPFLKYFPEPVVEEVIEVVEKNDSEPKFADLSPRDKILQMLMLPLTINNEVEVSANDNLQLIKENQPGFIVYFGEEIDFASARAYQEALFSDLTEEEIPFLLAVDHEGGAVQRFSGEGFTLLPSMRQLTNSVSFDQSPQEPNSLNSGERRDLFDQSAQELFEVGINLILAPMVDYSATASAILGDRVGNDPDKIMQIAKEYIRGFSNWQIMPVIKHFPGIGSIKRDLHFGPETIQLDPNDGLIFEKLLDQYPNIGVMSTHLRLKDKFAGQPCSLSEQCVNQLHQFYPELLLITDDLLMESASYIPETSEKKTLSSIAIEAIEAGNQVLLFGPGFDYQQLNVLLADLEDQYEESLDFQKQVDEASKKILSLKGLNN
jgi:beta-N-acetylhexosaminidase